MSRSRILNPILIILALLATAGITTDYLNQSGAVQAQVQRTSDAADRPLQSLRDLSNAFVDIADEAKPSVVTVFSEKVMRMRNPFGQSPFGGFFDEFFGGPRGQQPEQEYRQRGLGSGVIISQEGYIVTNNHVIADADTIFVRTSDNQQYAAKVIGADPKTDIAVLQIEADDLRPIKLGNSDNIKVGEWVLAVGSPLSAELAQSVTQGIVSAKGRSNVGLADYEDFIQTDAAINPGNSGGPLINLDGEVIGINTAIATRSGGYQGIGFAVPVNMVRYVMEQLISDGEVVRGWLGVSIQDITPAMSQALGLNTTKGAIIGEVVPGGPADKAGLEDGDVILEFQGQGVENMTELRYRIASTPPGEDVSLTVVQNGSTEEVEVRLGELPDDGAGLQPGGQATPNQLLGFSVTDITPEAARKYGLAPGDDAGVVVTSVDPSSSAASANLREGDVIRSVNRRTVRSVDEFRSLVADLEKGNPILLRIQREGAYFFVSYTL